MTDLKEILTDSYCTAVRNHFDTVGENGTEKLSVEQQEIELYRQLEQYQNEKEKVMSEWADTPIDELDGTTPSDLINGMQDFDEVFELFLYMAENADDEVPHVIIEKLKTFEKSVSVLTGIAGKRLEEQNTDTVFIASVSALGEFRLAEAVHSLISLAYKADEKNSDLDYIEEALKNSGTCTVDPILETLEGRQMGDVEKMLLYVLASVGSRNRDDRIYKTLRQAFRTMDDKMTAVICLNEYGDGRAIPMLRGYLERNRKIEKDLFFEIVGTIKNLGGMTEEFLNFY